LGAEEMCLEDECDPQKEPKQQGSLAP
jgi:hypothetical protein